MTSSRSTPREGAPNYSQRGQKCPAPSVHSTWLLILGFAEVRGMKFDPSPSREVLPNGMRVCLPPAFDCRQRQVRKHEPVAGRQFDQEPPYFRGVRWRILTS